MGTFAELLALQELDSQIDSLGHRRANLAERAALDALAKDEAALRARRDEVASRLDEARGRQEQYEAELAAAEQRIAVIRRRLYSGEVSASRDLQAMSAEMEHLQDRSSALEDEVLASMEARDPLESEGADLQAGLERVESERAEVEAALAAAEAAVSAEIDALRPQRQAVAGAVPAQLVATYERLRQRLGGVAVARLVGNHCDGCHLTLSAAELERVRHLPDGEIYTCEQCTRIIVPS